MGEGRKAYLKIAVYSAAGLFLAFMLFVVIFSGTSVHRIFPETGTGIQLWVKLLTLENFSFASIVIFCAGTIWFLVRQNIYSIAALAISSIIEVVGFALFWKGSEWILAVVLILISAIAGVFVMKGREF